MLPEEQVQAESRLAQRLLSVPAEQRASLYAKAYDEIYSMWLDRDPNKLDFGATSSLLPTLLRRARPRSHVLEVGCGTALLAVALAEHDRRVAAVDVSQVALDRARERAGDHRNLELRRVDGFALPYADQTFDFAYSIEVIEHLHEDDARAHFAEVARVLRRGSCYWFKTPNSYEHVTVGDRFGVDTEAAADVHLKEWTHRELGPALRHAGFRRVVVPLGQSGRRSVWSIPSRVAAVLESIPHSKLWYVLGLNQCIVCATR